MAVAAFVTLSCLWLLGFTYLTLACVRIEGQTHPLGELGAFIGTGWLRGSTAASRRHRNRALAFAAVGMMVIILVTQIAIRIESGM